MRVMSWNMAYYKPGRYKAIANRRRQWALLGALSPDVALLQECRPDDLVKLAPPWMAEEYVSIGGLPRGWAACTAVVARRSLQPRQADLNALSELERRWLDHLTGYVVPAELVASGIGLLVASVHAHARTVDNEAVTDADHMRIKRRAEDRAWYADLAVAALRPLAAGRRFVIGGDWNEALLFDKPNRDPSSAEFFAARAGDGWHHALRKFFADEVRTYLDPKSGDYELDHLFTDANSYTALSDCHVLTEPGLTTLSDHAPVLADMN